MLATSVGIVADELWPKAGICAQQSIRACSFLCAPWGYSRHRNPRPSPDRFAPGPHGGRNKNNFNPTTFPYFNKDRKCEKLWTLPMVIDAPTGLNTIQVVARLAGVSIATVSRVANDTSNVSGEIKTKVMTVI
jgi:hypothetical protein